MSDGLRDQAQVTAKEYRGPSRSFTTLERAAAEVRQAEEELERWITTHAQVAAARQSAEARIELARRNLNNVAIGKPTVTADQEIPF